MKARHACRGLVVMLILAAGSWFSRAATGPETFSNPETIVLEEILRGPGTPYPSSIELSGFTTAVSKVTVTLHNISHTFPDDLDVVLVGPRGQSVMLMSDAGSEFDVGDVTLTFDDSAPTVPPNSAELVSGTFRPVNHPLLNDTNPPPAPPPPYGTALSVFNGTDPNGTWSLYVLDDTSEDGGAIVDGWSLTLSTDQPIADLSLQMITSPSIAAVGTNIFYTISVTNNGPAAASKVVVSNTLPSGVAFISATTTSGNCSNEAGIVRCGLPFLPVGGGGQIQIVATPIQDGILTNRSAVAALQRDHYPANNTAVSAVPVTPVTDLAVRVVPEAVILQGELVTSSVIVTNEGAAFASGVKLVFPLLDGVTFVSAETATGSCTNNSGTVQCDLGTLEGRAAALITVVTRWLRPGSFTNAVAVTGEQFDHDLADNTAATLIQVQPAANLRLSGQASAEPAGLGQTLTYNFVVSNLGPSAASVFLSNALPAHVEFISAAGGACINGDGVVWCELGILDAGGVLALALAVRPTELGTLTNATTVSSSLGDPVPADNSASVLTTVVPAADLAVTVAQSPDPVWRPESFTYTVTVSNSGPSIAEGVALASALPRTADLVSFHITQGRCVENKGVIKCDVGTLPNGASAILTITMAASQVGPLTNRTVVTGLQLDGDPRNNAATTASAAIVPIVRSIDPATINFHENGPAAVYPSTIFVSGLTSGVQQVRVFLNSLYHERADDLDILLVGPSGHSVMLMSDAGGDTLLDDVDLRFDAGAPAGLPDALAFESGRFKPTDFFDENAPDEFTSPAPAGPYATDLSVFNGTDPNGAWSLYILDDQPGAAGALFDGWKLEIAATAPIADVVITGVDVPEVISVGANAFSITLSNQGPFIARSLRITNAFAAELGVQAVVPSQGACEILDDVVVCAVGDVAPGSNVLIAVSVAPTMEAVTTNSITAFGQFTDFAPSNNAVWFVTSVERPPAILSGPQHLLLTNNGIAQFSVVISGTEPFHYQWFLNDNEVPGGTNDILAIPDPGPESEGVYRVHVYNRVGAVISAPATLTLTGPPRMSVIPDQSTDEELTIAIPFLVRDAETLSEDLMVTAMSSNTTLIANNGITIEGSGHERTLRVTPAQNQFGAATITVRVQDTEGHFSFRSFLLTVRPVNDPPSIPMILPQVINEDSSRVLRLILGDIDSNVQSLTLTGSSSNAAVVADSDITITGSGIAQTVTILPKTNVFGTTLITLLLTDGEGASTTHRFPLTVLPVNDPPALDAIANVTVDEDSGQQTVALAGISSGVENEIQRLRLSAVSSRPDIMPNPIIDYVSPDSVGILTFTPRRDANGTATINVTVNDSQATNNTVTRSFTVTVQPAGDPPRIADIPDQLMAEDTVLFVPIYFEDPDTRTGLTITAASADSNLISSLVATVAATNQNVGVLVITPNSNQFGTATVLVTVTDLAGLIVTETFLLTVSPVNDPPALDALPNMELSENAGPQTINLSGIGPGATNESDQIVVISAESSNTALIPHPIVIYNAGDSAGTLSFEAAPGQSGRSDITLRLNDGQSGDVITSFTITVHPENEAPTIGPLADVTTGEDTSVIIPVLLNDPDGVVSILSLTAASSSPSVVASTNILIEGAGAERVVTIVPNAERQGSSTITLTVSDGVANSSTEFVVTIGGVNDAPTLNEIPNVAVTEGRGLFQVSFTGVSSGATNESQSLSVTAVSQNTGLLTVQSVVYGNSDTSGTLRLRTASAGTGLATVLVTVDDHGASNNVTTRAFTVLVTPDANTPPAISNIPAQTADEDTPLPIMSFTISDPQTPADDLILSVGSSNPTLLPPAQLVLGGSGNTRTLAISPAPDAFGEATVTLSVQDGNFSEVTRSFPVTIMGVNDAPVVADIGDVQLVEDGPTAELPFVITDIDSAPESIAILVSPSTLADTLIVGAGTNRVLVVTPKADQAGAEVLTVTVTDGFHSTTQDVQLAVTAKNDAPAVALPLEHTGAEDTIIEIPLLLVDPDTPLDQITLTASSSDQLLLPDSNIVFGVSDTNRTLQVTPARDQFGQVVISVSAIDDLESIVTQSMTLTILPVNDPPTLTALSNRIIAANGPPVLVSLIGASAGPDNESQPLMFAALSSNTLVLNHPEIDTSLLQSSNLAMLRLQPVPGTRGVATVSVIASDGQAHVSRTFNVSVDGPPAIQNIPDQLVEVEALIPPVRLTVSDPESGATPLSVTAQASNPSLFANVALSGGGGTRTLTLSPTPQQIGSSMIHVVVTDPRGNSASNSFLVTIGPSSSPPVIQRQPESRTVAEGAAVLLDVAASGQPLTFQWQRDRVDLPGETNATLVLSPAQPEQSGEYRVLVSNGNGTVTSATATVRVVPVPRITSIAVHPDVVQIEIATVPGEIYSVEVLADLSGTNWVELVRFSATEAVATVEDPVVGMRFYRIRVE